MPDDPHDIRSGSGPDDEDTMIEDYLDCTGKKRTFRLQSYARGMFLSASEVLREDLDGMRFVMKMDVHGHLPWGEMREKIRRRMAERDVAVDRDTGELRILRGLVRGHIASTDEDDGPVLIVDDRTITWRELGAMLGSLEGWDLRIEVVDALEG